MKFIEWNSLDAVMKWWKDTYVCNFKKNTKNPENEHVITVLTWRFVYL